jgi:hypothetical protein
MNYHSIVGRFKEYPKTLSALTEKLQTLAKEYSELQSAQPIIRKKGTSHEMTVDLLATQEFLDKSLLGMVTGSFLTIRSKEPQEGPIGSIRSYLAQPAREQLHRNIFLILAS